ncbi:MAG: sugar transporter [Zunongwangia sp.]|jgi:polysaccharide export outer membrane protein|uniref:Sugar transporter n=1 Tax=Zunongwangia profunda TaxID=398743 RepID=A0A3D5J587_9FLAO|nr:polysaccharide biosynthesis/export family protein [Zunongwangia profunda]MAO35655.1 sugar transporter [Zunongwangia sp.]MCC4230152.1 polysaccharide biosynthesis/export family protein [Zunongwangia profunda]HCV83245.1 sugar transporter [Zunongwangia profunda]|tara:strand:- start:655 stop:1446 length:792 start_codon:yes stop_codon:yes gene_type:complete
MQRYLVFLVLSLLLLSTSCISTKKLSYLQEEKASVDSIVEVHRLNKPYRVQVGDLLSIRVKALDQDIVGMFNPIDEGNVNATGEERMYYDGFSVDEHGNIRVPTLGEVNVMGYTVEEIRERIEERLLSEYFKQEANIFVTVKLAGIRYTTIGEIGAGSNVLYKERVTIMEAIANAGGISDVGNREDVKILRQYPHGEEVHHIDLTNLDAVKSEYYYIQPNDLIIVDPLPQKSLGAGTTGIESFRTIGTVISLISTSILLFTRF